MLTTDAPFRVEPAQRREVDQLIADGLLEPLLPGVVGPLGCTRDVEMRVAAVALALPDRAVERGAVAQAAAAWVWCGGAAPRAVDLAVPPGRSMPRVPILVPHERRMPPQDVAVLPSGGRTVSVTTATRTLVDLLRLLPEGEALPAAAPLAIHPGVTREGVAACLDRMPRARGVPRARLLAARLRFGGEPGGAPAHQAGGGSVDALAGDPIGVEDAFDPADGGDHVVQVRGVGHLEGEA